MKNKKQRIITEKITKDDKIKTINMKDTMKAIGRSAYISFPKELVGKYVLVKLEVLE